MPAPLVLTIAAVFVAVAATAGLMTAMLLFWRSADRQRLRAVTRPAAAIALPEVLPLSTAPKASYSMLGRSKKEMSRLQQRLARAGFPHPAAPVIYTLAEYVLPFAVAYIPIHFLEPGNTAYLLAAGAGILTYFVPSFVIDYFLSLHRRDIQNGLPDALDLLVVCIEAGCGLDQAIVKAADELYIAYPLLADELRILTSEIRAGKPRIEAFKSLAQRTKVDDIRALVAMLIQTDRFGTS